MTSSANCLKHHKIFTWWHQWSLCKSADSCTRTSRDSPFNSKTSCAVYYEIVSSFLGVLVTLQYTRAQRLSLLPFKEWGHNNSVITDLFHLFFQSLNVPLRLNPAITLRWKHHSRFFVTKTMDYDGWLMWFVLVKTDALFTWVVIGMYFINFS